MSKPTDLAAAVHGASRSSKRPAPIVPGPAGASGETKGVLLRLPSDLHRELRLLALEEGTSLQAMGCEALKSC